MPRKVPRYDAFKPASETASYTKKRNTRKNTKAELVLRSHVWRLGLRYRLHGDRLPGKPDLVFPTERVAVFCDGDFWHGRNWQGRRNKLARGTNPGYWIPKIRRNMQRDQEQARALKRDGWKVLRLWETDILKSPEASAKKVKRAVLEARAKAI